MHTSFQDHWIPPLHVLVDHWIELLIVDSLKVCPQILHASDWCYQGRHMTWRLEPPQGGPQFGALVPMTM